MCLAYAPSPPIITFVGRPLASRKGLATFVDAIAVLETLDLLPPYQVWVVGGDTNEQRFVQTVPVAHSMLQELVQNGRWLAWGSVENAFLPEIYSRSTVVVIPSTFEQFGLVGLEAMACGCPVVASDVGGIRDTIVPGVTGELFPPDNADALANVLAGYLRSPQRRIYQGGNASLWARRFSAQNSYSSYYSAVCNYSTPPPTESPKSPKVEWRHHLIESSLPQCAELIQETISHWEDCSGNAQVGAYLRTAEGNEYHAKFVRPRPTTHSLVLPLKPELRTRGTAADLVYKYRHFEGSGLTPTIRASSPATGIVVTQWLPRAKECESISVYSDIVQRFAAWGGENAEIVASLSKFNEALQDFAAIQNETTLAGLDYSAAVLHAPLTGGSIYFQRIHPQVELFRVSTLLRKSVWSISTAVRSRLKGVLDLMLQTRPMIVQSPKLKHGSLKPAHLLQKDGCTVVCDLDNAVYAIGPLDAVHWHVGNRRMDEINLRETLDRLADFEKDEIELFLAACWLFVYLVYGLLDAMMRGKTKVFHALVSSLMCAYEGLFRHGLIRSE